MLSQILNSATIVVIFFSSLFSFTAKYTFYFLRNFKSARKVSEYVNSVINYVLSGNLTVRLLQIIGFYAVVGVLVPHRCD